MIEKYDTQITNILVIGSGGAGLSAAIECKNNGLSVSVIGKREKSDVHTVLAAGGINAAFGNIDEEDSWEQHFIDTYLEGYSIGDPRTIEIMTKEAPHVVNEIDEWGAKFKRLKNGKIDQRFFGAHKYRRTCYCGDYTGREILNTLLKKSKNLGININDNSFVTELLVEDNICFGAVSFNMKNGDKMVHYSDAVILATGGHTRIWKNSSSRKNENTGDGLFLALKAGCSLLDLEMVQFHPTGMLFPEDISGTLVTEAVRGEGGILLNSNGERFMQKYDPERMELSTRDRVALANYKEIQEGRSSPSGGVYLDISHKTKDFILDKLPSIYRQFIEYQMLDISRDPMEVAPTAHYSMGGILVSPNEHQTDVRGLYACGEVAGGLHGANRLGGNSLAEILIFGKRAGKYASIYSKNLKFQQRSIKKVNLGIQAISDQIKKGDEIGRIIEYKLHKIMWKYCGVLRDKGKLLKGLNEVHNLKKRFMNMDVRIEAQNYGELSLSFSLHSEIICAEATILSALMRKESRGAHQRSDYPNISELEKFNYLVKLKGDNQLETYKKELIELNPEMMLKVKNSELITNFNGRLIE